MSDNLADMSYEQLVAELTALRERRAKARERPAATKDGTKPVRNKVDKKDTKISAGAWALLDDDTAEASEEDPARDEKSLDELGDDLTK